MNRRTITLAAVMGLAMGGVGQAAQAAVLNSGDLLTLAPSVPSYDNYGNWVGISGGSWFAMDTDGNGSISNVEKIALNPGTAGGIVIGTMQSPGEIDNWMFGASPGGHYTTSPPTGGTTAGVDFSGWTVAWNFNTIPMNDNAWTPSNCGALSCAGVAFADATAILSWNGVYGDAYSLWYSAAVPMGHPSGFGGVHYLLHLEGVVMQNNAPLVPIPAAAWLFGSGLLGLIGAARRRVARATSI